MRGAVAAAPFAGAEVEGYEIHMGRTERLGGAPFCRLADGREEGACAGNAFGTYLHGLFDSGRLTEKLADWLLARKGLPPQRASIPDRASFAGAQYDILADAVRRSLDMAAICRAMEEYDGN